MNWRGAWICLFLLGAVDARAYRVEFIVTVLGERLPGSEICFFESGAGHGPAAIYLGSNDVRCLPADQMIDMPAGVWSFFGRHPHGWISAHGTALVQRGPANPEQGYRTIGVDLHRAAVISFERMTRISDRFAAYVPMTESSTYAPATFPLPTDGKRILVPAGFAFTLIRIRDGKPVGAGPLRTLNADETVDASEILPAEGQRDLILWTQVDPASLEEIANVEAPVVRIIDGKGGEHSPLFDMDTAGSADEGFVIFRQPPAGPLRVRLGGRSWRATEVPVTLRSEGGGTFVETPLVARLSQRVTITWAMPPGMAGRHTCRPEIAKDGHRQWTVKLLACPQSRKFADEKLPDDFGTCRVEKEIFVEPNQNGQAIFDLRQPGLYVAVLNGERSRLAEVATRLESGKDTAVELQVALPTVFGRITEGDRPVEAVVRFETGMTVTDPTGSYVAVLESDPLDNVIEVTPCDGSDKFEHIPTERIMGSRQYDIRIPGNRIEVTVLDASTGRTIPYAAVGRGLFETVAEARQAQPSDDLKTDEAGQAVLRRLEPGYFLRLCATAEGYSPIACAEPIELTDDTRKEVGIRLRGQTLRRGRIASQGPIRAGKLHRVSGGVVVEEIQVNEDGSFAYSGDRAAQSIVLTSVNLSLLVVAHPPIIADQELLIEMPVGSVRNFTVEISKALRYRSAWFTLVVGDTVVPLNVLAAHLTRRGRISYIEDGGPVGVVDVLETAPLRVVAALGSYPQPPSVADLFVLPHYASIRETRVVPSDGKVVFGKNN